MFLIKKIYHLEAEIKKRDEKTLENYLVLILETILLGGH